MVLHNRALAWQDISHANISLVVKSAWACYMPNNILVVFAHVKFTIFLFEHHSHEKIYQALSRITSTASDRKLGKSLGTRLAQQHTMTPSLSIQNSKMHYRKRKLLMYYSIIGASLSEPHTSMTSLHWRMFLPKCSQENVSEGLLPDC